MKKTLPAMLAVLFMAAACTPAPMNETESLVSRNRAHRFDQADDAYLKEVEKYRTATEEQVEVNKQNASASKVNLAAKGLAKSKEKQQVIWVLEQKNLELEARMDAYSPIGAGNWENFLAAFERDMKELKDSLMDIHINAKNY